MYQLRLNDGTVLNCNFCSGSSALVMSIASEAGFLEIAEMFTDPALTRTVTFIYGEMQDVYTGYTDLVMINHSNPGEYLISLKKEA